MPIYVDQEFNPSSRLHVPNMWIIVMVIVSASPAKKRPGFCIGTFRNSSKISHRHEVDMLAITRATIEIKKENVLWQSSNIYVKPKISDFLPKHVIRYEMEDEITSQRCQSMLVQSKRPRFIQSFRSIPYAIFTSKAYTSSVVIRNASSMGSIKSRWYPIQYWRHILLQRNMLR